MQLLKLLDLPLKPTNNIFRFGEGRIKYIWLQVHEDANGASFRLKIEGDIREVARHLGFEVELNAITNRETITSTGRLGDFGVRLFSPNLFFYEGGYHRLDIGLDQDAEWELTYNENEED